MRKQPTNERARQLGQVYGYLLPNPEWEARSLECARELKVNPVLANGLDTDWVYKASIEAFLRLSTEIGHRHDPEILSPLYLWIAMPDETRTNPWAETVRLVEQSASIAKPITGVPHKTQNPPGRGGLAAAVISWMLHFSTSIHADASPFSPIGWGQDEQWLQLWKEC